MNYVYAMIQLFEAAFINSTTFQYVHFNYTEQ